MLLRPPSGRSFCLSFLLKKKDVRGGTQPPRSKTEMYRSSGGDHYEQLETFIDQGYIEEILGLVKTGKEASVYFCQGGPAAGVEFVAAKVYRGRQYRFKNDAVYQQARGREMGISGRALRAMQKGSSFGKQVTE